MDPTIGWYQPEQFGPAKDLWLHIWEAEKGLDVLTLRNDASNAMGVRLQQDFLALDTSPTVAATAAGTTPSSNITGGGTVITTTTTTMTNSTGIIAGTGIGTNFGGANNNNGNGSNSNSNNNSNNNNNGGGNANNGNNGRAATAVHGNAAGNNNGEHRVPHNACNSYYNPSRRKSDNRASTYGMNYNYDALVGEYGGCPWRVPNKHYSKGVIGLV
jgi:non-canonical poly(A) RNA polymerase PAPD5/7